MFLKKSFLVTALLAVFLIATGALSSPEYAVLFEKAKYTMETKGDLEGAIKIFNNIIKKYPKEREFAAKSQLYIGLCYEKLGVKEARTAYERVVREYADQSEIVAQARVRLAALGGPGAARGLVTRRVLADASGVGGVLTPDGKYISSMDKGTGDMVQFEVASGQTSRIKNRGGAAHETVGGVFTPVYSRDGKQFAYTSYTKDWVYQVWIRNLDGSGLRTLYSEKDSYVRPLDWSPDAGSILALRSRDGAKELTLISTADGSVRVLRSITSEWFSFKMASFSPDERYVAFSSVGEGSPPQGDVFLMTADGRNEVVVAGHPAEDRLLGWTPDGRSLLFLSDRSGTWDIWTVHITGGKQQGEPELLKKDFDDSEVLGFAPDGSFYYKTHTSFGHLYSGAVDLETGKVLVPPAPVTTRYTSPTNFLTWSPDGSNLAYLSHPGQIGPGNNILTIRSTATGEERFLSPRLRFVNQISWAPDGRSVIAYGMTETGTGAFRIDTETSVITKLAHSGLFPKLCPDGKTLVFAAGPIITKRNLDTGEESEVVNGGGTIQGYYDLSPDGREVVFQVDGAVKAVSLNGGEPRELFRGLAQHYGLMWTRDGRYIIARAFGTASSEIWRVPAQGGKPLKLDISVPKMVEFTLHPDNRRFAFSVDEGSKSELWVMENFLPQALGGPGAAGGLVTRRVLTDASGVGEVFTADGKYIRGIDWKTGDVVQFEVASGQTTRITNRGPWSKTETALQNQAFSRDGKQIAYDVESSDPYTKDWVYQVRIRNLDGSGLRTLYSQKDYGVQPLDWSPDAGSILAYRERNKGFELTLISTADGSVRVLRSIPSDWVEASFSPDGRFVAFSLLGEGSRSHCDVRLMTADGRNEVVVAGHPAENQLLGWTPDGRSLVFRSDRSGTWDIWTVHITGGKQQGEPELLKKDFAHYSAVLGFAPDGSLYYKTDTSSGRLYNGAVDLETGKVLMPPAPVTTRYTGLLYQLTWSPDGRNLLYFSRRGGVGSHILTIRSAATGEERFLSGLGFVNFISWAPDGRSVIAIGTTEGKIGIVRIDTETRGITRLADPADLGQFPKLCPDGKTLVFAWGPIIMKRSLDTGEESEVVNVGTGGTAQWYYDLSPDGREVVFQVDGAVKTVSLNGGEPRELFRGLAQKYRLEWTRDGRYIIARARDTASSEIWRVPAQGGTPLKLDLSVPKMVEFTLHPDNRRFAFSVDEGSNSELWVMENFLPK